MPARALRAAAAPRRRRGRGIPETLPPFSRAPGSRAIAAAPAGAATSGRAPLPGPTADAKAYGAWRPRDPDTMPERPWFDRFLEMQMSDSRDVLICAGDAHALALMLGDRARVEDDAAAALATTLAGARIVDADRLPADVAAMGATVDYVDPDGRRRTVTLAYPAQADAGAGRVSVLSPVGRALLGRRAGSVATVLLPDGRRMPIRIVGVAQRMRKDAEALALV